MEHAADTAEAAAVDHYFSSPNENISVPVCLWTPGNRLMIVLWVIRNTAGGAIRGVVLKKKWGRLKLDLDKDFKTI